MGLKVILFLVFCFFSVAVLYADSTSITTNFPAANGSYNTVVLANPTKQNPDCSKPGNIGMLYLNTTGVLNRVELCASYNDPANPGQPNYISVPAQGGCYNRFCSCATVNCNCTPNNSGAWCPAGYKQEADINKQVIIDKFTTDNANNTVYTSACCPQGILGW